MHILAKTLIFVRDKVRKYANICLYFLFHAELDTIESLRGQVVGHKLPVPPHPSQAVSTSQAN